MTDPNAPLSEDEAQTIDRAIHAIDDEYDAADTAEAARALQRLLDDRGYLNGDEESVPRLKRWIALHDDELPQNADELITLLRKGEDE
jgi:hypothetical protein